MSLIGVPELLRSLIKPFSGGSLAGKNRRNYSDK